MVSLRGICTSSRKQQEVSGRTDQDSGLPTVLYQVTSVQLIISLSKAQLTFLLLILEAVRELS